MTDEESMEWIDKIPWIRWPNGWDVKAIFPFAGVMVRYLVRDPETGSEVSIFLDCHKSLTIHAPCWEVYAYGDNTMQCEIDDVDTLLSIIRRSLISRIDAQQREPRR